MQRKIRVSINVTTYYDASQNNTARDDQALFIEHELHWEDFFSRSDVVFEDVTDEEDSGDRDSHR